MLDPQVLGPWWGRKGCVVKGTDSGVHLFIYKMGVVKIKCASAGST